MFQTFANGEALSSVRAKINANAVVDSSVQTGNFSFGASGVGWNVPVDLSGGNIVGTLPASPINGQIVRVYGRAIPGGSANRFSFAINGGTLNGAASPTTTGSTGFETANFNTSLLTELKCVSASTLYNSAAEFSLARTGARGYQIENDGASGFIEMVFNVAAGGATFSYWVRNNFGTSQSYTETVNGVSTGRTATTSWVNRTIALSAGTNTIRLTNGAAYVNIDDLSIGNLVATAPAGWTSTANRTIGPGGYTELQYSSANSTWHVVQHSVLGNYEMPVIAGTNAAVSMIANCHYQLDGSILTADRTYTLPAGVPGDRVRVSLTNGNASWECILSGASGVTINGGAAATEWSRLRIAREHAEFVATSSTNWDLWSDGRIPQKAKMRQNNAQNFSHDTATKIAMDATLRDNANIADLANDRFVVFRSGTYRVTARASLQSLADLSRVLLYISVDGVLVDVISVFMSGASAVYPLIASEVDLAAGGYVEVFMSWDVVGGSGTKSSFVSSDLIKPVFSIEEML